MAALFNKRIILVACLLAFVAAQFWGGSRYPALNEKLMMGTDTPLAGLAFNPLLKIAPDENVLPRILYETVNWIYTNRQGMTFGILFGALLLTLLRLLRQTSLRGRFGNTVMGMLIGAPLGVCANCAAPIGKAIHAAGGRIETMLAAMFSSPTLNVIVVTMVFALFPFHVALVKVALTVGFILIAVPLLTRVLLPSSAIPPGMRGGVWSPADSTMTRIATPGDSDSIQPGAADSWLQATGWVVKNFALNLWFIIKTTVPLMLLAGFLGAIVVTLLPLESLAQIVPSAGRLMTLLAMGGIAILGVFLPVPMSFDVIVTAILWQAGLPIKYAAVLLFTLGIFSIFPFFIIWKTVGRSMAISLFVGLAGLGLVAGFLGHHVFKWDTERQQKLIFSTFSDSRAALQGPRVLRVGGGTREQISDGELQSLLQRSASSLPITRVANANGISVDRVPFQASSGAFGGSGNPEKLFTRLDGSRLGLDEPYSISVLNFEGPYAQFRGIASGDVHNDGWVDLLLTSDSGLSLYANRQGTGFALQPIDIPVLKDFYVVNAALVDLNNDGWLDIFFATYRHGNYVIYNNRGRFVRENLQRLRDQQNAVMPGAVAFGDVDKDGLLDIVLGAWAPVYHGGSAITGNKVLLRNDHGRFLPQPVDEVPGPASILQVHKEGGRFSVTPLREIPGFVLSRQTLSLLLSDIDNDGNLDLIVGNEDLAPDSYHLGNGKGGFRQLTRQAATIPYSTATTMSVATADIDNDLLPEIYVGQITGTRNPARMRDLGPETCTEITEPAHRKACEEMVRLHRAMPQSVTKAQVALDVWQCMTAERKDYRQDCIAYSQLLWARHNGPRDLCERFSDNWEFFRFLCRLGYDEKTRSPAPVLQSKATATSSAGERAEAIPALIGSNVLLAQTGNGRFVDKAGEMGVQIAGFTWNARFADLDNDEFVDLYAVNGWFPGSKQESHYFYRNDQGKKFVDATQEAGLVSFLATSAYTYVDLDNDGDLDIVSVPIAGPVVVYINNSRKNRIAFELRDRIANHFGIGSKVIIHYGPGGTRHQMREIQASGGFISFDAPIAYFGLGGFERVERVEVLWSTGERSEVSGDFAAGARYIIRR